MFRFAGIFILTVALGVQAENVFIQNNGLEREDLAKDIDTRKDFGAHINDFLSIIDVDAVVKAVLPHLMDPEVSRFIEFLLSDDLKNLVRDVENVPEFKEITTFLKARGFDVTGAINAINSLLNIPPYSRRHRRSTSGINGLIDDIIRVLPVQKLREMLEEKIRTDPEVARLFETLRSEEFHNLMQKLVSSPRMQEIKRTLEGYGFNFDHLCHLAKEIFGEHILGFSLHC